MYSFCFEVLSLLQFLIMENQQKLKGAISCLEPFPDIPEFRELRSVQHRLKYSSSFELRQVTQQTHGLTENPHVLLSVYFQHVALCTVKKRSCW